MKSTKATRTPLRLLAALLTLGIVAFTAYQCFTSASRIFPHTLREGLELSLLFALIPGLPAAAVTYGAFSTTSRSDLLLTFGLLITSCAISAILAYGIGTIVGST